MTYDGNTDVCKTCCKAGRSSLSSEIVFPVFELRSNLGKLLLEISKRILCPLLKQLLVAQRSMLYVVGSWGVIKDGSDIE